MHFKFFWKLSFKCQFQSALLIYDLGILGDDRELSNAVWRRFFMTEEYDFEKIELMVRYIRRNLAYLETLSLDDLITKSKINWVPVEWTRFCLIKDCAEYTITW